MPKVAKELTQLEINRLKPKHANRPTVYAVGGIAGMHVQITASNARSWLLIVNYHGKRHSLGLGSYPEVSLKVARDEARLMRQQIREGKDPIKLRNAARLAGHQANLFEKTLLEAFEEFLPIKREQLPSEKYRRAWGAGLKTYILATLGSKTVSEITTIEIIDALLPIWDSKSATAEKIKHQLKEVFAYSIARGYRKDANPVSRDSNFGSVLKSKPRTKHYPALNLHDVRQWMQDLRKKDTNAALALQFQALTATRTGAVIFATMDEIDLDTKIWTVQPDRKSSKIKAGGKAMRVPLTDAMIEILNKVDRRASNSILFPAPRGGAMSDATLGKCMRNLHTTKEKIDGKGYIDQQSGKRAVPHGLRTTFKTWANEVSDYQDNLSEIALWHNVGNRVHQAYSRTDMAEKRRAMMADYGAFIL